MSFEGDFQTIYTKFKLHFYREIFGNWTMREATLTTVETFCMEVIYAMQRPTINEFANFIRISQPNAAYKVNNLIRKGFLRKVRSQKDKREYFLEATDKYIDYLDIKNSYICTRFLNVLRAGSQKPSWKNWTICSKSFPPSLCPRFLISSRESGMHNRSIYVWQERFNAIITRSAGFVPLRKAVEFDSLLFMSYYSEDIIFYGKTRTKVILP